ncbi:pectinesterase inhibitor 7-like [Vicia villosa]|uniref:pectinesterase inhibitor 7-like n=1 Tax=Vicia villosa TaxID=3911 RepID=UPI00273CDEDA|nr:pectinesterase inhibitor 7-like [Vicia villosa]
MKTQRPHQLFLLSIIIFASTFSYLQSVTATGEQSPTTGTTGDIEFIRSSCNTTLYPDICYTSLSRYANAVQQNPGQLARIAIAVSFSKVHRTASYLSNLTRVADYGGNSRAALALHDCFSNLNDAVDEIRGSIKQMRQIGSAGAGASTSADSFLFQMSNVQTWMSAALTDEETCTDGFQDVENCPMKTDVNNRVTKVKKFTSNALALVNGYASKGMP